jgi:hypothetical protein
MGPTEYHLNQTVECLTGASKAQIIAFNQWAATAFNKFHPSSNTIIDFEINDAIFPVTLKWDSDFDSDAMKERRKIAEEGGVSMAFFVMSVILDYKHVMQTEIGEGVDYRFHKIRPNNDNFLLDSHFVEVSGLLEESPSNTLNQRITKKHSQIDKGTHIEEPSSIIVTLFNKPITVKEIHR